MTRSEALAIAHKHVASLEAGAQADLSVNDALTEKHPAGYVFFYNTKRYWETRDMMTGLAGNGPLLVREDGSVVALPANQSLDVSLAAM